MTDGTARAAARAVFGMAGAMLAASIAAISVLVARSDVVVREAAPDVLLAVAVFLFPVAGFVIARRQPRNGVAWVFLGVGFAWTFSFVLDAYSEWAFTFAGSLPGGAYAAAFSGGMWVLGIAPLGTFLLLLFPDGRLPTPRWRLWAWFCGAAMLWVYTAITLSPGAVAETRPDVVNPMAIEALDDELAFLQASVLLIPLAIVGCIVALVRRYRRSRGIERLQMKWFVAACSVVGVLYVATMILSIPYDWGASRTPVWIGVLQNASFSAFLLIPISVGIAITRHRLYDIDRIINRAIVYAAATGLLALVYAGGVVGSQAMLRSFTGRTQNNLSVAASTLAVAALFGPVRSRVQAFVDRRFYRGKYDAALTVEAFSAHLRQETDLEALTDQLRGVIAQTVQPAGVTLWIAEGTPAAPARP
jgi:hypothetical protein